MTLKRPSPDWTEITTRLLAYGVGMLFGILLVYHGLLFLDRDDPAASPFGELVLLFVSLPVGAVAGATGVWILRVVWSLFRVVVPRLRSACGPASRRMVVSPVCRSCGRPATSEERAVSGLCPVCREPLFYWLDLGRPAHESHKDLPDTC